MLTKFAAEIEKLGPFENQPQIAVGVSGGIDSTALALLSQEWARKINGKIIALTVNHSLRPESTFEAEKVGQLLEEYGIEHHVLTWQHAAISANIQAQAREARKKLLTNWCRQNNVLHLLLAHTKNDYAETFLMRIFRGSGIYGLASMPRSTVHNQVLIGRPLLSFTKFELRRHLEQNNVEWIDDSSNTNMKFTRTQIRSLINSEEMKTIVPDQDLLLDRLALNAKNLSRIRHYIEDNCAKIMAEIVSIFPEGYLTIDRKEFNLLSSEIAMNILSRALITISGKHVHKPRLHSLEGLYEALKSSDSGFKHLWECEIQVKDHLIYIYRGLPKYGFTVERKDKDAWVWDNRFKISAQNPAIIRLISNFDLSKLKDYDKAKYQSLPKRIWQSLPLVTTTNNKDYVPFIRSGNEDVVIKFIPSSPLAKIDFDY